MKIKAKDLIQKGYFMSELPPPFISSDYANKYETLFKNLTLDQISKKDLASSECTYYSIPKAGYNRRVLGIPNPLHYTILSKTLEKNFSKISAKLKSRISSSLPVLDPTTKRALVTKDNFPDFRRRCFLVSKEATYELKVDISRYYSTIYTHIIPWVMHGREVSKKNRGDNLLGNLIDKNIRNLQSGQTMGIPIGPDSSLLVSELIGCELDRLLIKKFPNLKGVRYIDDCYFYFTNRAEAEKVLKYFQSILTDHLLTPNEEKTTIKEFPFSMDPLWAISLRSLKATCFKDDSEPEQESDIRQFFSAAFDWAEKYPKDEVMKFSARTILGTTISDSNWAYFEAWLIKMGLYDPYTLPEICLIIFTNRARISKKSIKSFIYELLERHSSKRHSFEISWTLWLAKILGIKIKKEISQVLFDINDPIPTIMALDLVDCGLINKEVKLSHLKVELNPNSLMDGRWILAYEAGTKAWVKASNLNKNFIKNHPFFSKIAKSNISFYDSGAVAHIIPLPKKVKAGDSVVGTESNDFMREMFERLYML